MQNLKPCPCGKIPNSLLIADNGVKWAYAFGDCCNEWHIEFRTAYNPIDSDECMSLAVEAWNIANREAAQQSVRLTSLRRGLAVSIFINVVLLAVVLATIGGR